MAIPNVQAGVTSPKATPQEFYTSVERFAVYQRFTQGYRVARWALTAWANS